MNSSNTVICIHGIWGQGLEMTLIKRRLEKEYGFNVLLFNYPSVRGTLDENAEKLSNFIADKQIESVHMLGHSLGGIIALRMLANHPDSPPGRVVCIGSPLTGSRAAEKEEAPNKLLERTHEKKLLDAGTTAAYA